jgi:hypothetical protein
MAERNETLIEGDILFKDLKSKRKTERITARALTAIVKNKHNNTNKLREMHRRALLFSIKYIFANVTVDMQPKAKKEAVKFFNELAESKDSEDELQKKAKSFVTKITGDRGAYLAAINDIGIIPGPIPGYVPKKKAAPKAKPVVEAIYDSEVEEEKEKVEEEKVKPMIEAMEKMDKGRADEVRGQIEETKKRNKEEKKMKITKANYVDVKLKKESPIKLTKAQKEKYGGDLVLYVRFVYSTQNNEWMIYFNEKPMNPATETIFKSVENHADVITKHVDELLPYLSEDEAKNGTMFALRTVIKAFLKGETLNREHPAIQKAANILDKLDDRANQNKENGLKFNYDEDTTYKV